MRTTLNLDDEILETVMKETAAPTKSQAVRQALQDFVQRRKIEKLISLQGKDKFNSNWRILRKGWTRSPRGSR